MKPSDAIWKDIEGFAVPPCPACGDIGEPSLDDYGFFCELCGDDIPNGAEFDDCLAAYRAAIESERAALTASGDYLAGMPLDRATD